MIQTESQRARPPLSVSELALEIRRRLQPLAAVLVKGEVSGFRMTGKRNYSFSVRDRHSVISAFLYADDARRLPMLPEDGQEYILRGRIQFWPSGQLTLVVQEIQYDDVGKLRAQLEKLKQRLEAEGAFEPGRKRPVPFLPRRVALITSPTGAVIHDLQETIRDRFPNMDITVYPALVQGVTSPGSVVIALRRCNDDAQADVVVIARGGGSFEELYAFNTEPVARAILASRIPVVTALGHTSDRTVADMVADAECRTPTEAGARVVPVKADLTRLLDERAARITRSLATRFERESDRLAARGERLRRVPRALLERRAERLRRFVAELARLRPADQVARRRRELVERERRLAAVSPRALQAATQALAQRERRLAALSPDGVLARGYAIAQDEESGKVLRASADTSPGRRVRLRLGRGALRTRVDEVLP